MKNLKIVLPFLLLVCSVYIACNKDDIITYHLGPDVSVTFAGQIVDEAGEAVIGAVVSAGDKQTTTDKNGVFRLPFISADSRNAILWVKKDGYFEFSRAYVVQDGAVQTVTIQLLEKAQVGTISSTSGGSINLPGGAKLSFPANAVAYKTGGVFTGTARVLARYLDPTDPNLGLKMPGDLRAINASNQAGVLATFGMIGVEIADASGQELHVASGKEVEIRMPIPASLDAVAPSQIPLWHYDTEKARWIEDGVAQKIGNEYVGMVSHFSFWNCDSFSETVYMEGKVFLGEDQSPLANAQIRLTVLANGFQGHATTNGNGWFGGAVPKDMAMTLEVLMPSVCGGQVLYSQNVGPLSANTVLPDITISSTTVEFSHIEGRLVNCNGQAVANGYTKILWNTASTFVFADSNGDFDLFQPVCVTVGINGSAVGYDLEHLLESASVSFTMPPNHVDLGNIPVCNALAEYIQYTLDGQLLTNINVSASVIPIDSTMSTGEYFTVINSQDSILNNVGLWFKSANQPGTYPIITAYVSPNEVDISNSNLSTTVTTTAANVGDLIIGTFGTSFTDLNGGTHTISGSYRVIRDY